MRAVERPAQIPEALVRKVRGATEFERARRHFFEEKKVDGFSFSAYSDASVKDALSKLFGGFCAYCESYYDATQTQDVEHYRPKGRIDNGDKKIKPGYWWLAAHWENLVPSCILCNRETIQILYDGSILKTGKGDRFPLLVEADRATAEGAERNETPLLIDPCRDDPDEYLTYADKEGKCIVVPKIADENDLRHQRARVSIEVYGLNRTALVVHRTRYMKTILYALSRLEQDVRRLDIARPAEVAVIEKNIIDDLEMLKSRFAGMDCFSAMARWLIQPVFERLGIS